LDSIQSGSLAKWTLVIAHTDNCTNNYNGTHVFVTSQLLTLLGCKSSYLCDCVTHCDNNISL